MFGKRFVLIAVLATLVLASAVWAKPPNVRFVDVRALGMGGPGITTMNNFSALMYNPAMLSRSGFHLDLVNFQMRLGKDVVDMVDVYDKNKDIFDDFENASPEEQEKLVDDLTPFDDNWMGFGIYPQFGLTFHNFAVGAYATADIEFNTDLGLIEPRVYLAGVGDYVFTGGLAFKMPNSWTFDLFPNDLYAGAALKIIKRYQVRRLRMNASDIDLETAYDSLIEESDNGFGIDLGFLYELVPNRVDVGAKVTDLFGSIGGDKPPMIVNVGASLKLTKMFVIAADYNDVFFHDGENVFNKLHFGGELKLAIIYLRGGFGQGYPCAGAGLNLGILAIDGAIYGIERTDSPGGDGDYNYAVRVKLGI